MIFQLISFGTVTLWLISFALTLRHVEPFHTHFYWIAWWCYILLLASRNELRRQPSLFEFPSLFRQPAAYGRMVLLSAAVWFLFELYNVRLQNWAYVGVPAEKWIRWPGYFIAFGSVLPGLFETARGLETWILRWHTWTGSNLVDGNLEPADRAMTARREAPRVQIMKSHLWERNAARRMIVLGALFMVLPLLFPRWFFPAVWVGFILVLDPLIERTGQANLVMNLFSGDRWRTLLLLYSGMVCGFFWEFWNYWSGAKWVYTLPYFQFWKIFEMPLLGFLGFAPFALECWLVYAVIVYRWRRAGALERAAGLLLWAGLCLAGLYAVDHYTVRSAL